MKNNFLFFTIFLELIQYGFASSICPKPVVDAIEDVDYHTKERFNKVRNAVGNTLTVRHIHHRKKEEEYDYTINFCGEKNADAVSQKDAKTGKLVSAVAKHDNASVLIGADDWLLLQYLHGKKYNGHHCHGKNRQAWVSIRCEDQGRKSELKVIEEARFDTKDSVHKDKICYYLFEFNHPAACSPRKKSLSGGAIFCIIVLVLFAAYFICGFIYQRVVLGQTGLEQIPHYSLWKKFGNTMADGCDFVCRSKDVSNNLYKGITDDLDIESSDDDKDGLLPM